MVGAVETSMKFRVLQSTRIGGRRLNQDRTGYAYAREGILLVVADGMGGHPRGELAAHVAVESILSAFTDWTAREERDAQQMLRSAFSAAHEAIRQCAEHERLWDLPRTTCTACLIVNATAHWCHVGDSRLYLVRDGSIAEVTRDHSGAWLLVEQGVIEPDDARRHPDRNFVYNCLGGDVAPEMDVPAPAPLRIGDRIVLCSDGFWAPLTDDEIASAVTGATSEAGLQRLMIEAESRSGIHADNLTYLALLVEQDGEDALDMDALALGEIVTCYTPESDRDAVLATLPAATR